MTSRWNPRSPDPRSRFSRYHGSHSAACRYVSVFPVMTHKSWSPPGLTWKFDVYSDQTFMSQSLSSCMATRTSCVMWWLCKKNALVHGKNKTSQNMLYCLNFLQPTSRFHSPQSKHTRAKKFEGTNTPCDFDHEHQLFRHHHAMWNLTLGLMSEFFLWSKGFLAVYFPVNNIWRYLCFSLIMLFETVFVVLNCVYVFNLSSNSGLGERFGCVANVDVMFPSALCHNAIAFCNTGFLNLPSQWMNELQTDIKTKRTRNNIQEPWCFRSAKTCFITLSRTLKLCGVLHH